MEIEDFRHLLALRGPALEGQGGGQLLGIVGDGNEWRGNGHT